MLLLLSLIWIIPVYCHRLTDELNEKVGNYHICPGGKLIEFEKLDDIYYKNEIIYTHRATLQHEDGSTCTFSLTKERYEELTNE